MARASGHRAGCNAATALHAALRSMRLQSHAPEGLPPAWDHCVGRVLQQEGEEEYGSKTWRHISDEQVAVLSMKGARRQQSVPSLQSRGCGR